MADNLTGSVGEGDRLPSLIVEFRYRDAGLVLSDDVPVGSPATFTMRPVSSIYPTVDAEAAVVVSSVDGVLVLRYDWQAGDTDMGGQYLGWFTLDVGGLTLTAPTRGAIKIEVTVK